MSFTQVPHSPTRLFSEAHCPARSYIHDAYHWIEKMLSALSSLYMIPWPSTPLYIPPGRNLHSPRNRRHGSVCDFDQHIQIVMKSFAFTLKLADNDDMVSGKFIEFMNWLSNYIQQFFSTAKCNKWSYYSRTSIVSIVLLFSIRLSKGARESITPNLALSLKLSWSETTGLNAL